MRIRGAALPLALLALLFFAAEAQAVVPVRVSPRQRLLALLPYLIAAVVVLAALVPLVWLALRVLSRRLRAKGYRRPALTSAILFFASALSVCVALVTLSPRRPPAPKKPPPIEPTGTWATFMGSCARTGCAPGARGPEKGEKLWAFCDGLSRAPFGASPAVAGGRVYVGSDNRKLYCFDARTGDVVWTFEAACEVFASPVLADGRLFLGEGLHESKNSKLYCLDAATGTPEWTFPTASHIEFSPTLFGGKLYVAAGEDGVYCLDPSTGRALWQYPGVHVDMSPAVTERGVLFGSVYGSPACYCLDPKDGRLVWKKPAPLGVCGSPSTDGERAYFGLGNGTFEASHKQPKGAAWCLAVADGGVVWTREVKDAVLTTIALADGSAYFGSRDGHLYCVDAKSGEARWAFQTEEPILSSPAVASGRVYFGSNDANVYCLDAATGREFWRYDTSQVAFNTDARVFSSPAVADDRVFVGSMNFYFFCLGHRLPETPLPEKPTAP